jgi:hypothetical protein
MFLSLNAKGGEKLDKMQEWQRGLHSNGFALKAGSNA